MSNTLNNTIAELAMEAKQLTADALAQQGDKLARWQRAQEIKEQSADWDAAALPAATQEELNLLKRNLIFLLAESNKPAELKTGEESVEASVRRIHTQSLRVAREFGLAEENRETLRHEAELLHDELMALAREGANQTPDWQRDAE
ncbi:MAG: hypothetical protein IPL78_05930 [Chloroflexi bacterium]|nr:hypothetical protein [Chloroflexota bacterium]